MEVDRPDGPGLDAEAGRTHGVAELRRCLLAAPPAYVEGAMQNPRLGNEELVLLLRNWRTPESVLTRIAKERRWAGKSEVRRLLVQHPQAPLSLARSLLATLFWKELMETSVNLRVKPILRRQAERLLQVRMEELTVGEKITLARRAPRGVLGALIHSDDSRVLRSVLENPAVVEREAVTVAGGPHVPVEILRHLAAHPRWGPRRAVRRSLLRNPRTPVPVALKLVGELPRRELRQLIRDPNIPKIVRVAAERRLGPVAQRCGE